MLKKEHKILVVVSPEPAERKRLLSRLAVRLGFALIPSDAAKIISNDIYGIDLATAYFVFCSSYNFRGAVLTNQRLYEIREQIPEPGTIYRQRGGGDTP